MPSPSKSATQVAAAPCRDGTEMVVVGGGEAPAIPGPALTVITPIPGSTPMTSGVCRPGVGGINGVMTGGDAFAQDGSALVGFEQVPVAWSQVPAMWHWSNAVQITGT